MYRWLTAGGFFKIFVPRGVFSANLSHVFSTKYILPLLYKNKATRNFYHNLFSIHDGRCLLQVSTKSCSNWYLMLDLIENLQFLNEIFLLQKTEYFFKNEKKVSILGAFRFLKDLVSTINVCWTCLVVLHFQLHEVCEVLLLSSLLKSGHTLKK